MNPSCDVICTPLMNHTPTTGVGVCGAVELCAHKRVSRVLLRSLSIQ